MMVLHTGSSFFHILSLSWPKALEVLEVRILSSLSLLLLPRYLNS